MEWTCLDLAANREYQVLKEERDSLSFPPKMMHLDYTRKIVLCSQPNMTIIDFFNRRSIPGKAASIFHYYKLSNESLHFEYQENRLIKQCSSCKKNPFLTSINLAECQSCYLLNIADYDDVSGLCYDRRASDRAASTITFRTILDPYNVISPSFPKYVKNPKVGPFTTSCFDPQVGVFAIDWRTDDAQIFKPLLDYKRMDNFTKTMSWYDRMLVYDIVQNGYTIPAKKSKYWKYQNKNRNNGEKMHNGWYIGFLLLYVCIAMGGRLTRNYPNSLAYARWREQQCNKHKQLRRQEQIEKREQIEQDFKKALDSEIAKLNQCKK